MDKLVKSLNQYEKERLLKIGCEIDEDIEYYGRSLENGKIVNRNYDRDVHSFLKYYIISKDYEFIKWLIENDKINIYKLEFQVNFIFPLWKNFEQLGSENIEEYLKYESLIMILSISDTPIEDLISYLK